MCSTVDPGYNQLVLGASSYGGGGPKAPKHGAWHSSVFGVGRQIPAVGLPAISVPGTKCRGCESPFSQCTEEMNLAFLASLEKQKFICALEKNIHNHLSRHTDS